MLPTAAGDRYWRASGIVIPWHDGGRLCLVKIRQPEGRRPRYAEAHRDGPRVYPGPETIRPGLLLVMCEGELDALLLGQELAGLAAVVTLGPASVIRPEPDILGMMLPAPIWFLATDADEAGDSAASGWPARAHRVRPPAPHNDWTEAALSGIDLRCWWIARLAAIAAGEQPPADEPAADHGAALAVAGRPEEPDREERAAIMEFDGCLTREAAERSAGLA